MPDDRAKRLADEALQRLMAELEQGRSDALRNYLSALGRFHRYSWNNVLLIHSQRPEATRVAGFHTWHELGRSVKKGEKGIMILAPVIVKARDLTSTPEQAPPPENVFRLAGFRTAYVFDVAQTEGKPLPQFARTTGDPKDYAEKLKELVAKQGIELAYDRGIAPAQGVSTGGKIRLMPDLSPAEEFSVLTHELAHEMLHHRNEGSPIPGVVRETQAEAVAFVVCRSIGLETNSAAADYIALYNGDKKTLADSLAVIQETSSKILDDLLPEQQRTTPAQRIPSQSDHIGMSNDAGANLPERPPAPPDMPEPIVWDR